MKTQTINGVPYDVNEKGDVHIYKTQICIGKWDIEKQDLILHDNWEKISVDYRKEYREKLQEDTKKALERAAEQQGVSLA